MTESNTCRYCIGFVDIVGSTMMKETQTETAWYGGIQKMYTIVEEALTVDEGLREAVITKGEGDGYFIAAPSEHVTAMINAAIRIHAAIDDANHGKAGSKGEIDFRVTIGIATGYVKEIRMPDGRLDILGQAPDRAARLCGAATARGLLVDQP